MSRSDKLSEYSEAFCFFQPPVLPGQKRLGLLDTEQLDIVMRSLGLKPPTREDWRQFVQEHNFSRVNEVGKGHIDFEDFLFLIEKKEQDKDTRAQLSAAFEVFDEGSTGFIKSADLKHMMLSLGKKLNPAEVDELILEADAEGTGHIRYDEFIDVIMTD